MVAVVSTLTLGAASPRGGSAAVPVPPQDCNTCSGGVEPTSSGQWYAYWDLGGSCPSGVMDRIDCTHDIVRMSGRGGAYYSDRADAYDWMMSEGCDGGSSCFTVESPSPEE